MHFAIQKDVFVKALKDVSNAIATRVVQPVLSNILIESIDETTLKFQATDLDLSIESKVNAVVYTSGSITLPGKKLVEIVSKLPNELVSIQVNKETLEASIQCKRSKFSMTGFSAEDFPKINQERAGEGFLLPADILRKSILQTAFAAASYDVGSILSGVYMLIEDGSFQCASTDGSRLANRQEMLTVGVPTSARVSGDNELEGKTATAVLSKPSSLKAVIPARACNELVKLIDSQSSPAKSSSKDGAKAINETIPRGAEVRMAISDGLITFETEDSFLSSRLISGEYPRFQELFPKECKYLASFHREEFLAAIDRVAVMSDDRMHLIKLHFEGDTLQVSANTPDVGNAQEEVQMKFEGQVLDLAVNVRYIFDVLQRLTSEEIQLEMTGSLKPMVIKAVGDENYKYLLMPVQSK
jgi:DNA polymerase III subunit beta